VRQRASDRVTVLKTRRRDRHTFQYRRHDAIEYDLGDEELARSRWQSRSSYAHGLLSGARDSSCLYAVLLPVLKAPDPKSYPRKRPVEWRFPARRGGTHRNRQRQTCAPHQFERQAAWSADRHLGELRRTINMHMARALQASSVSSIRYLGARRRTGTTCVDVFGQELRPDEEPALVNPREVCRPRWNVLA